MEQNEEPVGTLRTERLLPICPLSGSMSPAARSDKQDSSSMLSPGIGPHPKADFFPDNKLCLDLIQFWEFLRPIADTW